MGSGSGKRFFVMSAAHGDVALVAPDFNLRAFVQGFAIETEP